MPKRKRRDKQPARGRTIDVPPEPKAESIAAPPPADEAPPIDASVALFAQRHQQGIEREKDVQRQRATERHRLGEHDRLVAAKDETVAAMKRINRASGASQADRDAAEAAYRAATADLIAHETGERPTWAPVAEPTVDDLAAVDLRQPDDETETETGQSGGEVTTGSEADQS